MSRLKDLWFRIRALLGSNRMDQEFSEEMKFSSASSPCFIAKPSVLMVSRPMITSSGRPFTISPFISTASLGI